MATKEERSEDLRVEQLSELGRARKVCDQARDPAAERPRRGGGLLRCRRSARLLTQDRLLELAKILRRLDPQLVDEHASGLPVGSEGLRLAAGAVEGEHELPPQALAQRMLGHERLELADEVRVTA